MSTLIHYNPFSSYRVLQNEINRLFERDHEETSGQMAQWPMRVDIREDSGQITIKADLPGLEEKEIRVHVDNGLLTVSGERKFADEAQRESYHRVERIYGRFSRSFQLPSSSDSNAIHASCKNGVLEVVIPKREEAKPRAIEVKVH